MPISSGLYNQTLTLYTLAETADGQGGVTSVFTSAGTFRARISPLTSQERMSQDKATTFATHHVYCDTMSVTTADRILYGSVYFEIIGITNPSEAFDHLEIDVREID